MKITPGHGPASTPDVTALPEARLRVLRALGESQAGRSDNAAGPEAAALVRLTAHELAAVLGAHPNGVRRHLEALVAAGLVDARVNPARGRGRPSTAYGVTSFGRTAVVGAPISREYLAMATAFAQHVADTSDSPAQEAHGIGRTWGGLLAQSGDAAVRSSDPETAGVQDRLFGLLGGLGFSPARRPDGGVSLRTCPLLTAARANPEVLCQVHLGLVRGASEAFGGPADGGELVAFAEPGACVLYLPGDGGGVGQSDPKRSRV